MTAIGGENVTTTIEGRERYPVNIRYPRELREDVDQMARVLVPTMGGSQVPLGQLATIKLLEGPSMIRDEDGKLSGYVYVDVNTEKRDIGGYVEEAKIAVDKELKLKPGYLLAWSGQYEAMARVKEKMKVVLPLTLMIVFGLIYMNTKSLMKTSIVLMAVPFSAIGAVWFLYALGYNVSIGVWVGLIALLGLDAETGIFMLLYLDLSYADAKAKGLVRNRAELNEAILHGAVQRVRPKVMTVACAFFGLVPIMWSTGAGADVMKRIAAPMIGGLFTSFLMELLVYPAVYLLWRKRELPREEQEQTALLAGWHKLAIGSGIAVAILVGAVMFMTRGGDAQPLYPKYDAVRMALVNEDASSAAKRAKELADLAQASDQELVASKAAAVASAGTLEATRHAFAELSDAMITYRGTSKEEPKPVVVYCSMARHSWLQPKGPISNPYLGPGMKTCGEIKND